MTCGDRCRKRLERRRRWQRGLATLRAKYPGMTLEQIYQAEQQAGWERWTGKA